MAIYQQHFLIYSDYLENQFFHDDFCSRVDLNNGSNQTPDKYVLYKTKLRPSKQNFLWVRQKRPSLPVIIMIDEFMPRATYGSDAVFCWKSDYLATGDHDICLIRDKQTHFIKSIEFRVDIRVFESMSDFLENILLICSRNRFLLMDSEGKICMPKYEPVVSGILDSNGFLALSKFVKES
jgi:hypothetical protein